MSVSAGLRVLGGARRVLSRPVASAVSAATNAGTGPSTSAAAAGSQLGFVGLRHRSGISAATPSQQQRSRRSLVTRAEAGGDASAPLDSPTIANMREKISSELEATHVSVQDAYGDQRHVSIDVVSPLFEGKTRVARQRMVYQVIWEELQNTVHAVDSLTTKTPDEAAASSPPKRL
eukprot:jgi/Chlat1/6644/Chrsp49S06122